MASYLIIGGDNKEYGPVSEADVRLWISEGRLNGESRVKSESDAEFRALSLFPEFAEALRGQAGAAAAAAPGPAELLKRDYELDIGGCIAGGWEAYKANFGVIFGAFILMEVIVFVCEIALVAVFGRWLAHSPAAVTVAFNYAVSAALPLVSGPLTGGLCLLCLKTIRGQPAEIGDLFAGFQRSYRDLFLGALVVGLIVGACMLPFRYVWELRVTPMLEQLSHMQGDPGGAQKLLAQLVSAAGTTSPTLLVCLVPATFLSICWGFVPPLIIDQRLDFGAALRTSRRMVMKHWWQVFGLAIVAGLVGALGLLGCCIGMVFTLPISMMAMMFAYETIFGARKN